jgi:hypothetical protein
MSSFILDERGHICVDCKKGRLMGYDKRCLDCSNNSNNSDRLKYTSDVKSNDQGQHKRRCIDCKKGGLMGEDIRCLNCAIVSNISDQLKYSKTF